jgi:hypothetical protein
MVRIKKPPFALAPKPETARTTVFAKVAAGHKHNEGYSYNYMLDLEEMNR